MRRCQQVSVDPKEAIRVKTLAAIRLNIEEGSMTWHLYTIRSEAEIERLLAICLDCEKHPCMTRQCTWLKRLACVGFRECERWEPVIVGA